MVVQQAISVQKKHMNAVSSQPRRAQVIKTKKITQVTKNLLSQMLSNKQDKKDLKYFSFITKNDPKLAGRLEDAVDKDSFLGLLVQLGKEKKFDFTEDNVKDIPGSCEAYSVNDLIEAFFKLSQGSLEQFLTDIQSDQTLLNELNKDLKNTSDNLAIFLTKKGQVRGYTFTDKEVRKALMEALEDDEDTEGEGVLKKVMIGTIWS